MLDSLLPHYTYRRLVVRLAYNWLRGRDSLGPRLNRHNFDRFSQYRKARLSCNVCETVGEPFFDFPDLNLRHDHRIGELRETLQCNHCGATMRHRALVHAFLQLASEKSGRMLGTVKEAGKVCLGGLRVLDTDAFSATSKMLRGQASYFVSSFEPDKPLNTLIGPNHYNIDLERIGFDDDSFDIVLTSDVMEHVRDIGSAHREIARILKPGGCYVFTVPYDPDCPGHHVLVDTVGEQDRYLVPPQYHGDPLTGGILAYRVFGRALFADLEKLGLSVEFQNIDDPAALIVGGDVFVATKRVSAP
jgi:SAM-dependent methyltransferase